jgi:DNA-directed RNA polymerase subunit RPC12/RpoP
MTAYTCFFCGKKVSEEVRGKRIRCPYCGSKLLFKSRSATTKVEAI